MRGAFDSITVYNKFRNASNKDEWKRSVVPNCSWETEVIKTASGTTANIASSTIVLVSVNPDYRPFNEWVTDRQGFTFSVGDLVARGEILTEITGVSPYTESLVKASLLPEVFNVKAFADFTQNHKHGKHFEISGV